MTTFTNIHDARASLNAWLVDHAYPLWWSRGADQQSGGDAALLSVFRRCFRGPLRLTLALLMSCGLAASVAAEGNHYVSRVWVADQGDGSYRNPILHADYSDPDAVRVGTNYYMTASSFNAAPGLPLLQSNDLVNWRLVGHALRRQIPLEVFGNPQHGKGVWAPAIRHHRGEFYIYYPDPDFGIYLVKAPRITGPWSEPILVQAGRGLIDPCPLWDDDGKVYLVHAWARSRAGFNSLLTVKQLSPDGTRVIDDGVMVYDGTELDHTIEGPKLYKRNAYYYLFAPAGGVAMGWQTVLRSRSIYGPYERRVVIDQGRTAINGPHQGALVDTSTGEHWFLHFQDKGAYGRVVHLQPVRWIDDWPVIGAPVDSGKGEPVLAFRKPNVGRSWPVHTPIESDEFDSPVLGLQWQWQANPDPIWATTTSAGFLRLFSVPKPSGAKNASDLPNLLLQKFPAEEFVVTTRLTYRSNAQDANETAGLIIMGGTYASLALQSWPTGNQLVYATASEALSGGSEIRKVIATIDQAHIVLRAAVSKGAKTRFSYSLDGRNFVPLTDELQAQPGRWIGAKMGIFFTRGTSAPTSGFADFDWFRIEPLNVALEH